MRQPVVKNVLGYCCCNVHSRGTSKISKTNILRPPRTQISQDISSMSSAKMKAAYINIRQRLYALNFKPSHYPVTVDPKTPFVLTTSPPPTVPSNLLSLACLMATAKALNALSAR